MSLYSFTEHSYVYGEIIYMQLRELQSKHVLIYGDNSHAHKYVSLWTLLALQSNVAQYGQGPGCSSMKEIGVPLGCYQLTSILTSIVDGNLTDEELSAFSSMHSPGVNFVNAYILSPPEISPHAALSFELGDLMGNFHRGTWFNATAPLDGLVFSTRITAELSHAFISNLIAPYLLLRDVLAPPLALFFHKLQDDKKYMLSLNISTPRHRGRRSLRAQYQGASLGNTSSRRQLSAEDENKDLNGMETSNQWHENAMLTWLTVAKEMHSVDTHIFSDNGLRALYDARKEKILPHHSLSAEKNFCHDEDKVRSIDFVYSSLLASPRATLVRYHHH